MKYASEKVPLSHRDVMGTESSRNTGDRERAIMGIPFPWVIVILGLILLVVGNINVYTFGVFFRPIADDFGWTRGAVSGAYSLRWLLTAALVVPIGFWTDRFGPRWIVFSCFSLIGVSSILTGVVTTMWQYYLVQGALMGIGNAGTFVCVVSMVGKWHDARRGLALGITATGSGVSSIVFPPVAAGLIEAFGWRWATAGLGVLVLAIAVPAALVIKDPPAQLKGQQDGILRPRDHREMKRMLSGLMKDRIVIAMTLMLFFFYSATYLFNSHFVNYVTDAGISVVIAATMMSAMGIASTGARIAMGFVSDRIGTKADNVTSCGFVAGAFMLLLLTHASSAWLWVSAVILGIGFGGMAPLIPSLVRERYGTERLATITGIVLIGNFLGGVTGPWMAGFIFDVSKSYALAFGFAAVFAISALVVALWLPPPKAAISKRGTLHVCDK